VSAVFLDPDQMDATANVITAHAAEVEAAARDLEGVGAGAVPPALAGWLESELADIATTVRVTAVLYLVAAMDTIMRAEAMRTNQSLATAFPTLGTVAPVYADVPLVGGLVLGQAQPADTSYTSVASGNGFVLGEVDTSGYGPLTYGVGAPGFVLGQAPSIATYDGLATAFLPKSQEAWAAAHPHLVMAANAMSTNPELAQQLMGVEESTMNLGGRFINSRSGATSIGNGLFAGGGRIDDQIYRVPGDTGEYRVGV
jgi:hypothetical protein